MIVHTIFALIHDGVVKNICVGEYTPCDTVAKASFGPDAFAVEITQYPVQEGDLYRDGIFYRVNEDGDRDEILSVPTDSEEIQKIKYDMKNAVLPSMEQYKAMYIPMQAYAQTFEPAMALIAKNIYPKWIDIPEGGELKEFFYVTYKDILYRVREGKTHNKQESWAPDVTASMFEAVNETNAGTLEDPIPAVPNMEYFEGKYYSENGVIYYCFRSTQVPVSHMPSQLIGHYFEVVE